MPDIKSACPNCHQNIVFDSANMGRSVSCPHCQKTMKLKRQKYKEPESEREIYLKKVRKGSCYGILRTTINVLFWLCIITIILAVFMGGFLVCLEFGGFSAIGGGHYDRLPAWEQALEMISLLVGSALTAILVFALRQSAFLLIDIADTLLHEHSKTRPQ